MTILQVNDLVKAIEDEFGVTAAMPMMAGPMMMRRRRRGAVAEEKTEFDVILTGRRARRSRSSRWCAS